MFVGEDKNEEVQPKDPGLSEADASSKLGLDLGWNELNFFAFIVLMEHAILLLKWVLNKIFEDVPQSVQKGQRDNEAIVDKFLHSHKHDDQHLCQMADNQKKIRHSKRRLSTIVSTKQLASSQKFGFATLHEESSVSDASSHEDEPKADLAQTGLNFNFSDSKDQTELHGGDPLRRSAGSWLPPISPRPKEDFKFEEGAA